MYKHLRVLLSTSVLYLASSLSYGQEPATKTDAGIIAQPQEHVRHMRAHKTPREATDISQNNEMPAPAVAKQSGSEARKAPKVSAAHPQPKTKQVAQRGGSRVAADKQTVSRPVIRAEPQGQRQSDFFEELFN
jgi:hypothetical protein